MTDHGVPGDLQGRRAILEERSRNVSVQASAGTGKTTLMVERAVALVKGGVPMDRMVVVTFTDAAAAELRMRIRMRLAEEAAAGEGNCARALECIASSWISTIHGFASRVLREFFHLAGVDPAFRTTETHFTPSEINREWDRLLLQMEPSRDIRLLLSETGTAVHKSIALGMEPLRWLDSPECVGGVVAAEGLFRDFMDTHGEAVGSILGRCASKDDKLLAGAAAFREALLAIGEQMPQPDPGLLMKAWGAVNLRCGSAGSWDDLEEAKDVLGSARDRFREIAPVIGSGRLTELTWEVAGGFARWLRTSWDSDRSRLSYGDLLHMARAAVSGDAVLARRLREKFDHVLIDEFQDTSREQADLFRAFLERDGAIPEGSITVVADEKQSIYGWRNADIETYKGFRDKLRRSGALFETITTNFRSSRSIIRFVNSFGRRLFESQTPEEEPFGCRYSPIEPRHGAVEGEPVRVLRLPSMPAELKGTRNAASWSAGIQARWFAGYVSRGMESGARPDDFALLFRTGTHMHHFVDALEKAGIPYRVSSSRDFLKRQEIIDLRELLRCLLYPDDEMARVHTLRSLFFGVPDDLVNEAVLAGRKSGAAAGMECAEAIKDAESVLEMLRRGIGVLPLEDVILELLLRTEMLPVICAGGHQVSRRLGNLQHVLEKVLSREVTTPMELLHLLDEKLTPSRPEEPATVPMEGGAVTLSSIHSAKGLAWKNVVLAAMPSGSGRNRDPVISYDHGQRAAFSLGVPLDDGGKIVMRSPFWPGIDAIEKARGRAESRRLMYVAVTRPRDSLVIMAEPRESGVVTEARILWESLRGAMEDDPECLALHELEPLEESGPERATSVRSASGGYSPEVEAECLFPAEPRPADRQEHGARVGDMVHHVMEKIDMEDPEGWLDAYADHLRRLCGESLEEVRDLCLAFFAMELPFRLEEAEVLGREFPYMVGTPAGVKARYVDLLLRSRDGRLRVLDYKTDRLGVPGWEETVDGYVEKMRYYIGDISRFFDEPVTGHLVFLRHRSFRDVPENVN